MGPGEFDSYVAAKSSRVSEDGFCDRRSTVDISRAKSRLGRAPDVRCLPVPEKLDRVA